MTPEQYPDELKAYFGQTSPESKENYQNILVYVQTEQNKLTDISLEALGKAAELASLIGVKVEAVIFGASENLAKEIISYGANTIYLSSTVAYDTQKYSETLFKLIQDKKPEIVLFGQTGQSLDFAPRVAQKLKTALLTNCVQLDIDADNRLLIATSLIYNGLLWQEAKIPQKKPQMALLLEKKFSLPLPDKTKTGEIIKI